MFPLLLLYASLVNDVRSLLARHDMEAADRAVRTYQTQAGPTSEAAAALSWMGRAALEARNYDQAQRYSAEARKLSDQLLRGRKLDADPWLPTAVGASIEVRAQALAAQGDRAEAIAYLRSQLTLFASTSITERLHKVLNLLNLEGKPAPALESAEWLGSKPPTLASLRGHRVLLFFWAHWCGDCKAEVRILANIQKQYAAKGLVVIGPTRYYGYAAGGQDANPAAEKPYIEKIRQQFYSALPDMPVPVSAANFQTYGASTTPTLVLIDAGGIVRHYHPGAMTEADLAARIDSMLRR